MVIPRDSCWRPELFRPPSSSITTIHNVVSYFVVAAQATESAHSSVRAADGSFITTIQRDITPWYVLRVKDWSRSMANIIPGVRELFVETKHEELDQTLKEIQNTIILPSYLPKKQRKIVFDKTKTARLEQDPIVIEVEGYEHKFSTINRFKDVANSKAIFREATRLMQSTGDWSNLGALLAGYQKAGIKLKGDHYGNLFRRAGESDAIYTVLECAKEGDKTGLYLNNSEAVSKILLYSNKKVVTSGWDLKKTKQAFTCSQAVLDLLLREEHAPSENQRLSIRQLHFSKPVRGMMLFSRAAAVKAKQDAGEPVDQDLVSLQEEATTFESMWRKAVGANLADEDNGANYDFRVLNPTLEKLRGRKSGAPGAVNGMAYVQIIAQGVRGIELTKELVGDKANGLLPIHETLETHLAGFVESSPSPPINWDAEYETFVGRSPAWAGICQAAKEKTGAKGADVKATEAAGVAA